MRIRTKPLNWGGKLLKKIQLTSKDQDVQLDVKSSTKFLGQP